MNIKLSHIIFCACMLTSSSSASAGPSAHRTQEGSGLLNQLFGTNRSDKQNISEARQTAVANTAQTTSEQAKSSAYDGIWKDSDGQILLIKQIHRTLYISGSSDHAAWQAQCVMAADSATCIGNGISNTAGEFRYEARLYLNGSSLQSSRIRNYSNGHNPSSHSTFKLSQ